MDKNLLKQYIEDRVYENAAGLVTGDGNQQALLAIVDDCYNGPASASVLGSVKIGSGLSVLADGTLSYTLPPAGVGTLGGIRLASASILSNATLGVATTSVLGLVKADGSTTTVDGDGTIHAVGGGGGGGVVYHDDSLTGTGVDSGNKLGVAMSTGTGLARLSTDGPLKVNADGTSIVINASNQLAVGAVTIPEASPNVRGGGMVSTSISGPRYDYGTYGLGVRLSKDLNHASGKFFLDVATPTEIGGISLGEGLVNNSYDNGFYDTPVTEVDLPRTDTVVTPATRKIGGVRLANAVQLAEASILAEGSTPNRNYPLSLDSRGVAFVNVPWQNVTTDVPWASSTVHGTVKIGSGIALSGDGTISVTGGGSYVLPTAKTSELGGVKVASGADLGYSINATTGELTLVKIATSAFGVAKAGNGLAAAAGVLSVLLQSDPGLEVSSSGLKVKVSDGIGLYANGITLQAAGIGQLGGIKISADSPERGYNYDAPGMLEMRNPTDFQAGVVMLSKGLTVHSGTTGVGLHLAENSGLEFVPIPLGANDAVKIKTSTGLALGSDGLSLRTASASVLGGVKVDGTSITINGSGVISASGGGGGGLSAVSHTTSFGGDGTSGDPLSLVTATSSILGGVRFGDTSIVSQSGVMSLRVQSDTTLAGNGTAGSPLKVVIRESGDGLVDKTALGKTAQASLLGVQVDGTTIQINGDNQLQVISSGGGGMTSVSHDDTLTGAGTALSPLGVSIDNNTIKLHSSTKQLYADVAVGVPTASESTLGGFKVDPIDETPLLEGGTVYVRGYDMDENIPTDYDSLLKLRIASEEMFGIMRYSEGSPIYRDSSGAIQLRYNDNEFYATGAHELSLRPAAASSLGGVMVDTIYDTSVPSFLRMHASGRLGVNYDSRVLTNYGGAMSLTVKTGDGLSIGANGLEVGVASSSALGGVKIDNSTIKLNSSNQLYSTVSAGLSAVDHDDTLTGDGTALEALGVKILTNPQGMATGLWKNGDGLLGLNIGQGLGFVTGNKVAAMIDSSLAFVESIKLSVATVDAPLEDNKPTGIEKNEDGRIAVKAKGNRGITINTSDNEVGILSGSGPTDSVTTTGTYIPASGPTAGMLQVSIGSGLQFGSDGSPANTINVDGSAIAGAGLRGNSVNQSQVELALPAQTTTGDFYAIQKQSNGSFTWVSLGALDAILDTILGN